MSEERQIQLIKESPRTMSVGVFVVGSLAVHLLLLTWWYIYRPEIPVSIEEPVRYVEMVSAPETPQMVEGVGAPVETKARPDAPLSNANRTATAPKPSDGPREQRAGSPLPVAPPSETRPQQQPREAQPPRPEQRATEQTPQEKTTPSTGRMEYRVTRAAAAPAIDWKSAIKAVRGAEPAKGGGSEGDGGFAEAGPVSFESQWFDWGDYSDHMIRRIKVHWHANMPEIIKMGVKGVVTIRFTIERDGRISEIVTMESSGVPPFDFAARKALEQSSKLNPLPANFPGARERVTARFFYNMDVNSR